ncbi:MAG: polyphosphate kinase 1 [Nevskiales bacterium]
MNALTSEKLQDNQSVTDVAPPAAPAELAPPAADLTRPELFINRELALLEFNRRVLAQALDESVPLLERLRFLCISCTNLDEFFEIRVAALMQKAEAGSQLVDADQTTTPELLKAISTSAHTLVDEQYRVLNEAVIPQLENVGVRFLRRDQWSEPQRNWLYKYFSNELLPVLSPIGLDPAHPFPRILNKSLNFIVSLQGRDAFGRQGGYAVVGAPRALPRVIQLPREETESGAYDFVFLSSIIHANVEELFPGMKVTGCYQFRVTRNSDLLVDEEEVEDLLRALEGELSSRRFGDSVRLEVAHDCPEQLSTYLLKKFELQEQDLFRVNGLVNLGRLMTVPDLIDRPDLKYAAFAGALPVKWVRGGSAFDEIKKADVLLHHPFDSFAPVLEFLRQAAADPNVLAIKQTLYRTGPKSPVVDALVDAARASKEVTVVVELRARFDEAENIGLANRLQEAGVHVVYGVVGYKTHAKMIMVVRRENGKLRHYVHLGTGNYHPRTARIYTDYGLFTVNKTIGNDVHKLFLQLTSLGKITGLQAVLNAPFRLHTGIIERIEREIAHRQAGKPARIIIKMNALTEPESIRALYRAATAGVEVDLIIRGICCLRPNVNGVSENIRVRSIVGRFLEHSRVFYFHNAGEPEVYCASADWMERNFFRRVEACFPITTPALRERVVRDLEFYLSDNCHAWLLQRDGSYMRVAQAEASERLSTQQRLLEFQLSAS